ncbi:serine protease inhibitor 28Dc-like [Wyeomyia smithii]|uniref:serine protease inhibitor 28Dc-like n=1 Tax=Wyeomyia smithii TaxID=174621 RepID=UPI002467F48B|nr:serine protease inhibitor 28Dc-like [Wyeomyia smithii]
MKITSVTVLTLAVYLATVAAQQYKYTDQFGLAGRYDSFSRQKNPYAYIVRTAKPRPSSTLSTRFTVGSRLGEANPENVMPPKNGVSDVRSRLREGGPRNVMLSKNDQQLARAVVDLALNIGRSFSEQTSNVEVFSPVSIMGIINLLLLGAEGLTRTELLNVLQLDRNMKPKAFHSRAAGMLNNLLSSNPLELDNLAWKAGSCGEDEYSDEETSPQTTPKGTKDLRLANAIFAQTTLPLNDKTVSLARQLYDVNTQKVNFRDSLAASGIINKWVAQATNNKIREIASGGFPRDTNMVLVSSLYFKATWMTEFTAQSTKPRPFYPDGTDRPSFKIDTMSLSACLPYHFERDIGLRVVGLPYSDNATTMYVLMPQNSTRTKLRSLQEQLTADRLDSILLKMQLRSTTINFPRMQLESNTDLEKAFRRLGVKSIFSPQQSNLRLMLNQSDAQGKLPLYVSQIKHKVNLSVDERGTEGAAVTMTLIDRAGAQVYFNANQPFLIYVRHDPTRLPLFYGTVFDPRN